MSVCATCVRIPWERMRILSGWVKQTPLIVMTRGQSLFTFEFFPDDIVELTAERIFANGIRYHTPYDALNDMRNMQVPVRAAKKAGLYTAGGIVYTVSPVHTDDYYARKTRELVSLGVDAVYIKDPSGLLTPERAHTLVPALKAACGRLYPFICTRIALRARAVHRVPRRRTRRGCGPHSNVCVGQWRISSSHRMVCREHTTRWLQRSGRSSARGRSCRAPALHCETRGQAGRQHC